MEPIIPLERVGTEPLFAQVASALATAIASGELVPGQQIPTEPELSRVYGVSRITVRRSIDELCQRGMLVKRHGKGTFVRGGKVAPKINHISSFSESCRASGMTPSAAVLKREIVGSVPPEIADRPEFANRRISYIQRIHFADGTPVMIENNYYPLPRFEFLMAETLEDSLFETLAKHGVEVGGSENSYVDAVSATRETASHLALLVGDPLFLFYREMLDSDGELLYVGRQFFAGSRYRFRYDD